MNKKIHANIIYYNGIFIIIVVPLAAIPILITELSLAAIGILAAAFLAGLGCTILGYILRKSI